MRHVPCARVNLTDGAVTHRKIIISKRVYIIDKGREVTITERKS